MATPYNPFGGSGRVEKGASTAPVQLRSDQIRAMLNRLEKSRPANGSSDPKFWAYYDKKEELEKQLKRAIRRELRSGHFYINGQGEQKRGDKLFDMSDFPGKSPNDLKWPEAQGNDEGAKSIRADIYKNGGDPYETISEYIFRMNEPVIKRKRFLAMMLSKKESSNASSSASRSSSKPMSSKRAAYYDEDL